MRGSIRKRGNGYTIVYDIGPKWDEKKGRWARGQKWEKVPPPDTLKHAQKLLAKRLNQVGDGEYIEPTEMTLLEFKDVWMKKYAIGQVQQSTAEQYRYLFDLHIIPALGAKPLADIGVEDIQGLKSQKLAEDLSPQTVKHMLRLTRQMLSHACDWGYLRHNPARKVKDPKIPRHEMDCLTPEEVRAFLDHVPSRWYAFFLTAVTTGLRFGELVAMKWANLDLGRETYYVKETWQRPRGERPSSFTKPKTDSSRQAVDITPVCLDALREHRARQAEEKLKAGVGYKDQDLIFATETGTPLDHRNLARRIFEPALKKAGLRRIRFHDLRHTCASLLIHQGENVKYVQRQLRHASAQITLDRYSHLFPGENQEAARRLDATLFSIPSRKTENNAS